jgi:hypothetical protein
MGSSGHGKRLLGRPWGMKDMEAKGFAMKGKIKNMYVIVKTCTQKERYGKELPEHGSQMKSKPVKTESLLYKTKTL